MRAALCRASRLYVLVLLSAMLLVSCAERDEADGVELPTTPVLSFRAGWAVVDTSYARILEQPDPESGIVGHERRGALLEILSKTNYTERLSDGTDFWYQIRSEDFSFLNDAAAAEIYTSRRRALNASRILSDE